VLFLGIVDSYGVSMKVLEVGFDIGEEKNDRIYEPNRKHRKHLQIFV